ncbi:MAG: efflux transporter outer membrane subunit [Verrucomicrobiota bacterium]
MFFQLSTSHQKTLLGALALGLALALAGCESLPRPSAEPEVGLDIPAVWYGASKGKAAKISTGWLKTFRDRELNALVDEAMTNNRNLQVAAARFAIAREEAVSARSNRLPAIGARAGQSRTRNGMGPDLPRTLESSYRLALDASWEVDLWGRLRDLDKAAQLDVTSAKADFRSARLSLAANTAKAWFDFIAAVQQRQLATETLENFVRNHRITERNYKAGDEAASPLNVQLGRTNVASAERALVRARFNQDEAARALEIFIGRYPSAELEGRAALPDLPSNVPTGLPPELLLRRPDLVNAAAALEASAKRADAARKDLLPSISLSGGLSSSSSDLNRALIDPEYFVWTVASSLAQRVYEGGAPTAAARRALAQNDLAIRSFASLALQAFGEVESALARELSLAEQEDFLNVELAQANLAETQASRDYSEGLVGIISLFEAQRRAVSARRDMIELRNQRLQNRIDLHLALGGDFNTDSSE